MPDDGLVWNRLMSWILKGFSVRGVLKGIKFPPMEFNLLQSTSN